MKGFERLFMSKSLEGKITIEMVKSGIKLSPVKLIKRVLIIAAVLSVIGLLLFSGDYLKGRSIAEFPLILLAGWIISFFISLGVAGFFTYTWLTVKKNTRKRKIEEILSDYLQLVSANVGAGMPIDQALWYAVRERFGILVEEMEIVAKRTMAGGDLGEALIDFAEKYDSDLLKKSVVLLVEGLEAGGEVAELINKIAWNVREVQIMRKDISADVVTYVIFIGFAALVAAPLLFALSYRINIIMSTLLSGIDVGGGGASVGGSIDITKIGAGLTAGSFKSFAVLSLSITAVMSAMIISTVTKGSIKAGIRLIPIFGAVSLILFFILSTILSVLFKGLI